MPWSPRLAPPPSPPPGPDPQGEARGSSGPGVTGRPCVPRCGQVQQRHPADDGVQARPLLETVLEVRQPRLPPGVYAVARASWGEGHGHLRVPGWRLRPRRAPLMRTGCWDAQRCSQHGRLPPQRGLCLGPGPQGPVCRHSAQLRGPLPTPLLCLLFVLVRFTNVSSFSTSSSSLRPFFLRSL